MARPLLLAILLVAAPCVGAAQETRGSEALRRDDLRNEYERELTSTRGQWVVIGTHFRHADNCTSYGCVVMGPMNDHDACIEWSRAYNTHDPYDHTSCVDASDYEIEPY